MKTEENGSVMTDQKFDKICIPYPGKGLYWIISLPYLLLLVLTAIYLWKFSILVSSISKLGIGYCIGYVGFIIGHFITFILIICPKCANRLNCPTAKLSNFLYKKIFNKDILG